MLTFNASEFGLKADAIGRAAKQFPFATAVALTNAAKDAKAAEQDTMRSVFDQPTPFTLNALMVRPATKRKLQAELGFKEGNGSIPAWKYLGPEVRGGTRRHKRFEVLLIQKGLMRASEFAMPSRRCPRDGNGNVSGAFITRMLSALGAQSDRMQNVTARSKRRNAKRNVEYVVFRNHGKAPDGIYLQQEKWAVPIFLFVGSANYKKRFPYYEKGAEVIRSAFPRHFRAAWERFVVNDVRRKA